MILIVHKTSGDGRCLYKPKYQLHVHFNVHTGGQGILYFLWYVLLPSLKRSHFAAVETNTATTTNQGRCKQWSAGY
jgi:hypothetical protein